MTSIVLALASVAQPDVGPWLSSIRGSQFSVVHAGTSQETWEAEVTTPAPCDEVIASWKLDDRNFTGIEIFIHPKLDRAGTYSMGKYEVGGVRTSVNHQKDEVARVATDTLMLKTSAMSFHVSIKPKSGPLGTKPRLESLWLSLVDSKAVHVPRDPVKAAWGKVLEPPRLAQMNYPNGDKLCSPTAVAMLLGYWSSVLKKPNVAADVMQVVRGVYDPGWHGTGNWPFNMAFAASKPGMLGYVTRMRDLRDLEQWTSTGMPVACSVNHSYLRGKLPSKSDEGHLVVLVGFTPAGDPVFNDPGRNVVRMIYKRADFERAWATSGRTVYLVYPQNFAVPADPGPWDHNRLSL